MFPFFFCSVTFFLSLLGVGFLFQRSLRDQTLCLCGGGGGSLTLRSLEENTLFLFELMTSSLRRLSFISYTPVALH